MKMFRTAFLLVLVCTGLWAQATSQIQGVVQDASGSAVPGADVKATQTDTNFVRSTTTGADGTYVLANLPIGPYRLEVSKQGFTSYVQTGIVLQVATQPTIDVSLKVGQVTEQIQVEANAALVETQTTSVGSVIENRAILELPLNGRQATDLIQLTGAAIPQGVAGAGGFPGTGQIVIAGGQAFGVAYWLDGSLYNNPWDNANLPFPFPDSLQEFKVESSSQLAASGLHSGGSINAVTKAGTNALHGNVFEFLRNGAVNGRNFFQRTPDNLKRSQWGGTIGGALKRDKLFAFGGFQSTNSRQFIQAPDAFVPTQAMLTQGDFRACPSLAGNPLLSGGMVDPRRYDPASLNLAAKLPKSADPCGRVAFGFTTKVDEFQVVGRLDYNINDKQSLFGRYVVDNYVRPPAYQFNPENVLTTAQGALDDTMQSIILGHTYVISPTIVNSARVALNRVSVHRYNSDYFSACDLGVKMYCGYMPHASFFNVIGGFTISGATITEAASHNTTWQFGDDVTIVKGPHQIAFGGTFSSYMMNLRANVYSQGLFTFPSIPAFLLGQASLPNSITLSSPNNLEQEKRYLGAYVQDTWKVMPRLTLNVGLRYEPFFPPQETNGAIYNFNYANMVAGKKTVVYNNAPPGLTFPGDPGFPTQAGMNKKWGMLAPRIGLAWDPTGTGKMSIRASYGLGYDFANGQLFVNTANAPPFGNQQIFAGQFSDPFASNPSANIYPYTLGPNVVFAPYGTFVALQPNLHTTGVNMWNFAIQRQFGQDWLVSASYVGSQTQHLWVSYQLNPATIVQCPGGAAITTCNTTSNQNQRRLFTVNNLPGAGLIGYMDQYDDGGTASYNGLILAVQRRLSKGVSAQANYTWSHCIGDLAVGNSTGNFGTGLINPSNRRQDRGNCTSQEIGGTFSSDRRHIFNMTVVGEAPRFENRSARLLVTGWKLAVIYRYTSAQWLTLSLNSDRQLSAANANAQRPVQLRQNSLCDAPNASCWISPASFAFPAFGTISTMNRSNVPGPNFWQLDMALSRVFRFNERYTFEVRGEAFNLTNSFRAGVPSGLAAGNSGVVTTLGSPIFGTINSALDPRVMQFALKFVF
jgi:hypothetical protein